MTELAFALADEARRRGLLEALHAHSCMSIAELDELLRKSQYAEELAALTVGQVLAPRAKRPPLQVAGSEPVADAVLRQFEHRPKMWLSSRFFIRNMGLQRWTAQRVLGELVQAGKLERRGTTSNTRYRLARGSRTRVRTCTKE